MSSTLLEYAVLAGFVVAGVAKLLLRYGWRRVTAPRRRHRAARWTQGPTE